MPRFLWKRGILINALNISRMATVYILYSIDLDKYYTGSCKDLAERLRQHKEKVYPGSFTSKGSWTLFFSIDGLEYGQARKIEAHIKKMKSRIYINNLQRYPEIVEKLKLKYTAS